MKVLVESKSLAQRLRGRIPKEIEIIYPESGTDEELELLAHDVQVIVSTRLSADVARKASELKLLQKTGAGVDDMPFDALREEVYVSNTSGSNPVPLAEGAVALLLALAKRVVQRHAAFLNGRDESRGVLLQGKTVGILGMGSIGTEVAKRLKAFDMRVLGLRRSRDEKLRQELGIEWIGGREELPRILRESDFLVITIPLTPETRGIIGNEEIAMMKNGAYIINVARAAVIQEKPLYESLKNGKLSGAALDVWWKPHWWDPNWNPEGRKPAEQPFWELPNVICTPHNIGSTDSQSEASLKIIAENILRIKEGRPPINLVDKKLRY